MAGVLNPAPVLNSGAPPGGFSATLSENVAVIGPIWGWVGRPGVAVAAMVAAWRPAKSLYDSADMGLSLVC